MARNGTNGNGAKHAATGNGKPVLETRIIRGVERPLIPQPHGGAIIPGAGSGCKPGHGGRPKSEFKKLCQELASGEKTQENVRAILEDRDHPQFMAALRWASENGYGRPEQPISGNLNLNVRRADELKLARERALAR